MVGGMQNKLLRTLRCKNPRKPGNLGLLTAAIGNTGALIGEIHSHLLGSLHSLRDIEILVDSPAHLEEVLRVIRETTTAEVLEVLDEVRNLHEGGKIRTVSRHQIRTNSDLRLV